MKGRITFLLKGGVCSNVQVRLKKSKPPLVPEGGRLVVLVSVLGVFRGLLQLLLLLLQVHDVVLGSLDGGLGYPDELLGLHQLLVVVLEMSLISPPLGLNVFVVKGIAEGVPMSEIFKGVIPFWGAMLVCAALLIAFPDLALFLPETMIRN